MILAEMRVFLLSHEPLFPPTGGGSSEAKYLVSELVRRGHKVTFIGPMHDSVTQGALCELFNIEVIPFKTFKMGRYTKLRTIKYLLYPIFLSQLIEGHLRSKNCDLLIGQHSISCVAAGLVGRRVGIPVVMNFLDFLTGFMDTWPQHLMPKPILYFLKKFELSLPIRFKASGVLCISEALRQRFLSLGFDNKKLRNMYFGFDHQAFCFSGARTRVIKATTPVKLVMHGSMDNHHLGPILLNSLREISNLRKDNNIELHFIGVVTKALQSFIEDLNLEAREIRIVTHGFINYRDIAGVISKADIGLVPYEENDGSHCAFVAKAVEYAALGLPVVTTRLEGIQSYFSNTPTFRFSDFTGTSFASQVLGMIAHYPTYEVLKEVSEKVHAELSWQALCHNAGDFIESAACEHVLPV